MFGSLSSKDGLAAKTGQELAQFLQLAKLAGLTVEEQGTVNVASWNLRACQVWKR